MIGIKRIKVIKIIKFDKNDTKSFEDNLAGFIEYIYP